ncbi:hypothetical protein T07_8571 [Trichinella nelsoni]|uniref:Uncharacterized protein n=1 Tax=Trichinella nelsoni TaxID=6336 RepID=A0A0V0RFR7_9BILA|nr:hypothetical protein T07_8226 [Trichinella nelsoni]KRX14504.1 hypothetical protein T07_8571 [Trichinella nelsoni]
MPLPRSRDQDASHVSKACLWNGSLVCTELDVALQMTFYKEIWEELLEEEHKNEDNFTNSYNELAGDIWTLPKPFHRMKDKLVVLNRMMNGVLEKRNCILLKIISEDKCSHSDVENNTEYMVDLLNSLQERLTPRNVILSSCTERPTVALPNANYASHREAAV